MSSSDSFHKNYAAGDEIGRLDPASPWGRLEFERSCDLLARYLPPAPARIADIGGGPGVYAAWLAERGYEVSLLDPIAVHLEQAKAALAPWPACSTLEGDARSLPFEDQSQEAVLLMGPLYHLLTAEQRAQALSEALRVLRPGGLLFATAISRFAQLLHGLSRRSFDDPAFGPFVKEGIETGRHVAPPGKPWFTGAYYHRADELQAEVRRMGFVQTEVTSIEGPAWLMPNLADVQARDFAWPLHEILTAFEHEPEMLAISTHLLVTGFKPC